jgi:hypothetical protein
MSVTIDFAGLLSWLGPLVGGAAVIYILFAGMRRLRGFFARRKFDSRDRSELQRRWREVEAMLAMPGEMSRKMAILEADKLLDQALKSLSMPGQTLGERLKFAQYKHPELRDVWWAHRVRNQLAHEASGHLDASVAKRAVASFRKALERLGAI